MDSEKDKNNPKHPQRVDDEPTHRNIPVANPDESRGEIVLYQTDDGTVKVQCRFEDETIWMTQQLMADLFQTTKQNVGQHLRNIFDEEELTENSVVKKSFTTAADGKRYQVNFYNLDAIISVGY